MQYAYKFSRFKVNKFSLTELNFDLYFIFTNKSKLKFTLKGITTDVLVNDMVIAKIANYNQQIIPPESKTEIAVGVDINPKAIFGKLKTNWTSLALNFEKLDTTEITMQMNFKIGYGSLLTLNVPYTQKLKLSDLMKK